MTALEILIRVDTHTILTTQSEFIRAFAERCRDINRTKLLRLTTQPTSAMV